MIKEVLCQYLPLETGLGLHASSESAFGILGRKGQEVGGKRAAPPGAPCCVIRFVHAACSPPEHLGKVHLYAWRGVLRGHGDHVCSVW